MSLGLHKETPDRDSMISNLDKLHGPRSLPNPGDQSFKILHPSLSVNFLFLWPFPLINLSHVLSPNRNPTSKVFYIIILIELGQYESWVS